MSPAQLLHVSVRPTATLPHREVGETYRPDPLSREAVQPCGVPRLREESSLAIRTRSASIHPKHINNSYTERQNLTMRMNDAMKHVRAGEYLEFVEIAQ